MCPTNDTTTISTPTKDGAVISTNMTDLTTAPSTDSVINDAAVEATKTWSSQNINEKMRIVKGEYEGRPKYQQNKPFRFNLTGLKVSNINNIFVDIHSYTVLIETGILERKVKSTYQVINNEGNLTLEILLFDEHGESYSYTNDETSIWHNRKVSISFVAYYVDTVIETGLL